MLPSRKSQGNVLDPGWGKGPGWDVKIVRRRTGNGTSHFRDKFKTMYEGEWHADLYEGVGNLYYAADERGSDMYGGHWRGGLV